MTAGRRVDADDEAGPGRDAATDGGTADDAGGGTGAGAADAKRQLRLLGLGFVVAGGLTLGLSDAADPRGLLAALLGVLGVGALVLEWLQESTRGLSVGLLSGGVAIYAWPLLRTGDVGYAYLGGLMVAIGLVNVLLAPVGLYVRQLGERLAGRSNGEE